MHAYIRALVEVLPLAPDVFAPSCLLGVSVFITAGMIRLLKVGLTYFLFALY